MLTTQHDVDHRCAYQHRYHRRHQNQVYITTIIISYHSQNIHVLIQCKFIRSHSNIARVDNTFDVVVVVDVDVDRATANSSNARPARKYNNSRSSLSSSIDVAFDVCFAGGSGNPLVADVVDVVVVVVVDVEVVVVAVVVAHGV